MEPKNIGDGLELPHHVVHHHVLLTTLQDVDGQPYPCPIAIALLINVRVGTGASCQGSIETLGISPRPRADTEPNGRVTKALPSPGCEEELTSKAVHAKIVSVEALAARRS